MQCKEKMYETYLQEEGCRKIAKVTFYDYLRRMKSYEDVINHLRGEKKSKTNKIGKFKADNIDEVIDYAKTFGVSKTARQYNLSTRTVYRYINKK